MDKDLKMKDRDMMLTVMSFPLEWNFLIKVLEMIMSDDRDAVSCILQIFVKF